MRALWQAADKLATRTVRCFSCSRSPASASPKSRRRGWREFDLDQQLWTIPPERMKGDAAHVVPLTDDVIAILEALPRFKKGDYLFSTTFGAKPVNGFSKAKAKLDGAMAAELGGDGGPLRDPRHSAHHAHRSERVADPRQRARTGDRARAARPAQGLRPARLPRREAPRARAVGGAAAQHSQRRPRPTW